jgi:valyl-tRNA synthetase
MVEDCRKLRGEMNVSPAEKVPLFIIGDKDEVAKFDSYLIALAKLESVQVVEQFEKKDAPVALVGKYKLMLNIEIDPEEEKLRLEKEINRIQAELNKAEAKLNNQSFVERAPQAVVDQEKDRLNKFTEELDKFKGQLDRLKL